MEFYSLLYTRCSSGHCTPHPERIETVEETVLSSVETRAGIGTRKLAFEHRA
jgi:hypothetical protein